MYEEVVSSPDIRYAVAIVSTQRIDEINILQATLEGMKLATEAVMKLDTGKSDEKEKSDNIASAERNDVSYVITGGGLHNKSSGKSTQTPNNSYYALIDGNKVPKEICPVHVNQ